ncbi:NADH dehydrogenase [Paenibacillus darwinianus]|uniref:NADH-quinone oxidoreductase subunit I n=1 Tax=Paenibacillus darwinianus TaxID=1380763 RepID=A0A9W5RZS6_9BACL|nr:NADH-quinone oxidoreductase subunit NuoI [Paenibacillus darwinianus]EXX87448.1 NADH dehydrogenase [Paenibacillus darwinianus]EXX87456.1 NADH dehydrogenase [Paenibacillus darwinianus]EXX88864.1 NADH dehydrogenase [Paenibacillus darwinianus]
MKGLLKGLGVTFKSMTAKKVTYSYPDQPIVMPDRFRGIQYFEPDKCIVCNQCARVCPTECITLTGKPNPDPEKKGKIIDTYDINFEICILCDLCTEVCPTEAIVMTNNFELASYSRDDLFMDMEWLSGNDKNVRKDNNNIGAPQKGGAK